CSSDLLLASRQAMLGWFSLPFRSIFPASQQAVPGGGSYCGGLRSRLAPLHSDFAVKIGLEPASCNSLRALRPLRSAMHDEHETWRAKARSGPRPIFTAATEIAPAGYRLPRRDVWGCDR